MIMRMVMPLVIASMVFGACEKQNTRATDPAQPPNQARVGKATEADRPNKPISQLQAHNEETQAHRDRAGHAEAKRPGQQPTIDSAKTKPRAEQNTAEPRAGLSSNKSPESVTPLDQSGTQTDIAITQRIRQALLREDLSFAAKNVLVITESDHVVLKGQVRSPSEAERIKGIAAMVTTKRIEDVLEVLP